MNLAKNISTGCQVHPDGEYLFGWATHSPSGLYGFGDQIMLSDLSRETVDAIKDGNWPEDIKDRLITEAKADLCHRIEALAKDYFQPAA